MRIPLLRRRYFIWVILPALLWVGLQVFGPPHVIFEYTYTAPPGRYYDPDAFDDRHYHTCTYFGVDARFRKVPAENAWCPFIRFFPLDAPVLETFG